MSQWLHIHISHTAFSQTKCILTQEHSILIGNCSKTTMPDRALVLSEEMTLIKEGGESFKPPLLGLYTINQYFE